MVSLADLFLFDILDQIRKNGMFYSCYIHILYIYIYSCMHIHIYNIQDIDIYIYIYIYIYITIFHAIILALYLFG